LLTRSRGLVSRRGNRLAVAQNAGHGRPRPTVAALERRQPHRLQRLGVVAQRKSALGTRLLDHWPLCRDRTGLRRGSPGSAARRGRHRHWRQGAGCWQTRVAQPRAAHLGCGERRLGSLRNHRTVSRFTLGMSAATKSTPPSIRLEMKATLRASRSSLAISKIARLARHVAKASCKYNRVEFSPGISVGAWMA